jgi:hypothetical protein
MTAPQTGQAKEHNEKQDHVGGERGEEIMSAAICLEWCTGVLRRCPESPELQSDEPKMFR